MATELAAGLGNIALYTTAGVALTEFVPALRITPWPRRLAYGYCCGIAAVAGILWGASHFFRVPLRPIPVWTTVGVLIALGMVKAWRGRRAKPAPPTARASRPTPLLTRVLGWLAVSIGTVASLGLFANAITDPIADWDGRMTWCTQARYIRAAGTVDPPVLLDERWFITHPRYPVLLPVAQAAAQEAWGAGVDSHAFRVLYMAFFPAFLLLLYDGARRWSGKAMAAATVLVAALLPVLTLGEGSAQSTYSDFPLACFYGGALILLLGRRARTADGWGAGLLLAAAAGAKNEGLPLAVVALLVGALAPGLRWGPTGNRRRRLRRLLAAAAPLLLAAGLLLSWQAGIPNRQDEDYPALLAAVDPGEALQRPAVILPVVVAKMTNWVHWRGFWYLVPVLLVLGSRTFRRPLAWRFLAAASAPLALAWAGYLVHWDPAYLARATWDRTLIQAALPGLLLVAGAAAEPWRSRRRGGQRRTTPREESGTEHGEPTLGTATAAGISAVR
jgi:hypothetical protein